MTDPGQPCVLICWEHYNIMPNIMAAINKQIPITNCRSIPSAFPDVFYVVWGARSERQLLLVDFSQPESDGWGCAILMAPPEGIDFPLLRVIFIKQFNVPSLLERENRTLVDPAEIPITGPTIRHEHLFPLTENHFLKQKDWDARRLESR
jgi:hypothetical protein